MKNLNEFIEYRTLEEKNDSILLEQLNESAEENSKILSAIKDMLKTQKKEIILRALNIYYVAISHKVPLKEKMTALACLLYVLFPNDKVKSFIDDDTIDELGSSKNLLNKTFEILDKYIDDEIEQLSQDTFNEIFE